MKTKKLNSKLALNKKTIASLNQKDLSTLKGGVDVTTKTGITCVFCNSDASCVLDPCKCMYEVSCTPGCDTRQ